MGAKRGMAMSSKDAGKGSQNEKSQKATRRADEREPMQEVPEVVERVHQNETSCFFPEKRGDLDLLNASK